MTASQDATLIIKTTRGLSENRETTKKLLPTLSTEKQRNHLNCRVLENPVQNINMSTRFSRMTVSELII